MRLKKLEVYNRRDNVRVLGVPEQIDGENRLNECTVSQLVNISREFGAKVEQQGISVAHRLHHDP